MDFELIKLLLDLAIVPAVIFAYKMMTELSALKAGQAAIRESNSKEHTQVIQSIKELGALVREGEKDNRTEHRELGQKIHELETTNKVEHAILSNGGKL